MEKGVLGATLVAQLVKNLPTVQETPVQFLGCEDPLEKEKSYPLQYSGLKNCMDCMVHMVTKSRTGLSDFHFHQQDKTVFMIQIFRPLNPMLAELIAD